MKCFDNTFVVDYLDGRPETIEYLERCSTDSLYLPSIVLYEALQGQVRSTGPTEFEQTIGHLTWADIAPFRKTTARETGKLQEELANRGRELRSADAMIAGTARELDATLVTADTDFANEDVRTVLDVAEYR
ncbi:PIN domain-containing protein [Halorussus amylolyticus]|uniref:PIN domain-containing protein n=1 Tax=Halorussus amylolyticus TaxID=1126242 RepID=UPI00104998E4|nr:PIN domain-containing protein [Halorussus amylolyticus]